MKNTLFRNDLVVIAATDIAVWNGLSMPGVHEPRTVNEVKHRGEGHVNDECRM